MHVPDATTNAAATLSLIAPLFAHLTENEYESVRRADAAGGLSLPPWPARRSLQNELLVSGMPFAALPVESLYRPWSTQPGGAYGAARGCYLGDAACHVQAIYGALDVEVPARFAAAPDHLSLLLELLALFLDSGNRRAAADLAADHLGWLGDYDAALARRAREAGQAVALDDARRTALAEAIAHLRTLVALAGATVRSIAAPAQSALAAGVP